LTQWKKKYEKIIASLNSPAKAVNNNNIIFEEHYALVERQVQITKKKEEGISRLKQNRSSH